MVGNLHFVGKVGATAAGGRGRARESRPGWSCSAAGDNGAARRGVHRRGAVQGRLARGLRRGAELVGLRVEPGCQNRRAGASWLAGGRAAGPAGARDRTFGGCGRYERPPGRRGRDRHRRARSGVGGRETKPRAACHTVAPRPRSGGLGEPPRDSAVIRRWLARACWCSCMAQTPDRKRTADGMPVVMGCAEVVGGRLVSGARAVRSPAGASHCHQLQGIDSGIEGRATARPGAVHSTIPEVKTCTEPGKVSASQLLAAVDGYARTPSLSLLLGSGERGGFQSRPRRGQGQGGRYGAPAPVEEGTDDNTRDGRASTEPQAREAVGAGRAAGSSARGPGRAGGGGHASPR